MQQLFSFFAFILLSNQLLAQTQVMQWAKQLKGNGYEAGYRMVIDSLENVYVSGIFNGTSDFDPGPAVLNLTAMDGYDIYIIKLNSAGNLIWAKSFGGYGLESISDIQIDKFGNIYTAGIIDSTIDLDPGAGISNYIANGNGDIYISKLDQNGNFVWGRQIGGPEREVISSLVIDNDGFFYTTGNFKGTVDFDPGLNVQNLSSVTQAFSDIYISKFDFAGNLIWAKSTGGTKHDMGIAITLDKYKHIYYTGQFEETADLDPGVNIYNLVATGQILCDAFFSKLDSNGHFIWAKQIAGNSNPQEYVGTIAVNDSNRVYITGYFSYTIDIDPGPAMFNLNSPPVNNVVNGDSYVAKYDSAGNLIWARQYSGIQNTNITDLALDTLGDIYLCGDYWDTTDFDPGPALYNLPTIGGRDLFITKLNGAGDFQWVKVMGGPFNESCFNIATDKSGNVFTCGNFKNTVDFDPNGGTFNLIAAGSDWDAFIHKLSQCNVNVNTTLNANTITALATNSTFQWIRCSDSAVIPGATAQSYTPLANGDYAVIVSMGNCIDTSACIGITEIGVGVNEVNNYEQCWIYPNPSRGTFTLNSASDAEVSVTNTMGQVIYVSKLSAGIHQMDINNEASGIYFVKIKSDGKFRIMKLVKD